jgi:indolepyruvate decarboxylase
LIECVLFTYGTLMPVDSETAERDGWTADAVRGRLFDLGPYPALIDVDDPSAGWVEGYVRRVEEAELDGPLDRYEEVEAGLYRRTEVISRNRVRVWVYEYARPLPSQARGPLARWRAPLRTDRL